MEESARMSLGSLFSADKIAKRGDVSDIVIEVVTEELRGTYFLYIVDEGKLQS